nr:rod shape-determining protein [Desulfonema magnum]
MNSFFSLFSKDLAIDLGTANTLVYMKRKGIVLDEPSVIALYTDNRMERRILAVGKDAKKMLGKTPANIKAIRPMRDGVIADFEAAGAMLKHFIRKARDGATFFRPRVIIAIPFGITPVEKRAVRQAAQQAGAREVFLIEEPMAAAIGANLAVTEPRCNMVVDIGGGTTEVAVISLAGIVSSKSLRVAGDKMDDAIIRYLKKKYNFIIGEKTAEKIKQTIGNAYPEAKISEVMEVKGWDLLLGKPRIFSVDSEEIREAIFDQINAILETIKLVLDRTPQELASDVVKSGIVLTGGVALLKNLDKFLSEETGLPITIADNPLSTVAIGSGKALDSIELLDKVIIS